MKSFIFIAVLYGFTGCFQEPKHGNPGLEYTYGSDFIPWFQSALPADCIVSGMIVDQFGSQTMVLCNGTNYKITAAMHPFTPTGRCVETRYYRVCVTPDAPVLADTFGRILSAVPQIQNLFPGQSLILRSLGLWVGLMAIILMLVLLYVGYIVLKLPRRELLIFGGVVALALSVRLIFGLWAPIHANSHGIAEAEGVIKGVPVFMEGFSKGPLWYFFSARVLRLGLAGYRGLFLMNAVLSALACGFLFLAGRELSDHLNVFLAALVPVLFPGLVVLSTTEAPQNLVIFMVSIAVFLIARFYKSKDSEDLFAAFGAFIIGAALFFESVVLFLPALVLLWEKRDRPVISFGSKTGLTLMGIALWLPQGISIWGPANETDFIPRLVQAINTPIGMWNTYPIAFWGLIAGVFIGLFFIRRPAGLFLLSLLFAGLMLAILTLGAEGWSTDPIRYQSEAVFIAMPLVMLGATRLKGILAVILAGLFLWTLMKTPLPNTIEQQEFRFLQSAVSRIPSNQVIVPAPYRPPLGKKAICAFPTAMFQDQALVFQGPAPINTPIICYYSACQAARGQGIRDIQWLLNSRVNAGLFRYGVPFPPQLTIGFYQCGLIKMHSKNL